MSIESKTKRAAGFVEEEIGEMLDKPGLAHKGRALRNEGRIEDGVPPKLTEPGHPNHKK